MPVGDWIERIERSIWRPSLASLSPWRARGLQAVRTAVVLVRDLAGGELTLRAMSLVYTTLLSIVPLLALSFSVLKAFGVSNQIEPMLLGFLEPLGERGAEIARRIVAFIENMNVGVLGALGLAMLVYTAVSLMQKIEASLNFIWHVAHARSFGERFSRYVSALMVGPLLVFAALGVTATVTAAAVVQDALTLGPVAQAAQLVGRLVPYVLVIAAFTFVYMFIPNTRVRFLPALIGGVVAGIAWQTAGWFFAVFIASSSKYSAIYSSFAILLLFMIWLYLSWLILLLGASVAFYVQHPQYLLAGSGELQLSHRLRERVALAVASLASARFIGGEPAPTLDDFAQELDLPSQALRPVLDALEKAALLTSSSADPPRYLPAQDPSHIAVPQVLDAVRRAGEDARLSPDRMPAPQPVDTALERMQCAIESAVGSMTLRELAAQEQAPALTTTGGDASDAPGHRMDAPHPGGALGINPALRTGDDGHNRLDLTKSHPGGPS